MTRIPEGALAERLLDDGRELVVYPLLFGAARLVIGPPVGGSYDDVWDYTDTAAAIEAMGNWNGQGEPLGWMRHPPSGRRRPGGDPAQEYVRP